jgi:hypothetical protein
VIERKQRRVDRMPQREIAANAFRGFGAILAVCMIAMLAGCATSQDESIGLPPVSIQQIQYYPYLVKGYQKSFPNKRIVVLAAADSRSFKDSGAGNISHDPYQGHPAIGVIIDRKGQLAQRLYGPDLGPLVQSAIAQAAQEAGMISSTSPQTLPDALHAHGADYVLAARLTGLWVMKQRGVDSEGGPTWFSASDATVDVIIYKPPFPVAFWQGQSVAEYNDPPTPNAGAHPEDETEIYDQPGEVLSVALTRAVAGIFRRDDLHTLVLQDVIPAR